MPCQATADDHFGGKREQFRAGDALTSTTCSATRTWTRLRLHPVSTAGIPA
jgi:hypothetical protein